jgi:class 3 adenylate cyclase
MPKLKTTMTRWTAFLMRNLSRLLKLYIAFYILAFGLSYIKNAETHPVVGKVIEIRSLSEQPLVGFLKQNIPKVRGRDASRIVFLLLILAIWFIVDTRAARLQLRKDELKHEEWVTEQKKVRAHPKKSARLEAEPTEVSFASAEPVEFSGQEGKLEDRRPPETPEPEVPAKPAKSIEQLDREKLLEIYARTKRSLETQMQNLSFLAIDIVDSTGMKKGEDAALAERDFRQYKKLVQKAIDDNNGLKAAWTPDGVMICFETVENAVQAAKQVIGDLDHFNSHVKSIKRDFQVRAGINAGRVLFDDTVPMEEISDREIDIAGHMQKYADVNTIYVGENAIESMRSGAEFKPADRVIDGREVYYWKKEDTDH